MKRLLLLVILFSLSCNNQIKEAPVEASAADLLLEKSQKGLDSAIVINNKSDSATKRTITKVVKEIKYLNNVVDQYKQIQATTKELTVVEKIVYKIDTVYIETKKNFWGKEKTNTTIKTDSTVTTSSESTIKNSIDTLNRN